MSTFLMKALVSECHDIERTLDMLCWPSCSWPEVERVEALALFIKELVLKSNSSEEFCNGFKTKEHFILKLESVIWNHCVPLLKMISTENITSREESAGQCEKRKPMLHATCALLMVCVKECQTSSLEKIASFALPTLTESGDRNSDTQQLDIEVAIEVLAVLLSSSNAALTKKSLSCTLSSVKEISDTWVSKIIVRIWFTCLNSSNKDTQLDIISYFWGDLLEWHEQDGTEWATARLLLCLTSLSDYLFSLEQRGPNPEMSLRFFRVVQAGLVHKDNVSRKRALYLLNRCVSLAEIRNTDINVYETGKLLTFFFLVLFQVFLVNLSSFLPDFFFKWTSDQRLVLQEFWEAYTLVLETLEEYQVC